MGNLASLDAEINTNVNSHNSSNITNIYNTLAPEVNHIHNKADALKVLNEKGARWIVGKTYEPGDLVVWKDELYECQRGHRVDSPDWNPPNLINNFWFKVSN